MMGPPPQVDPVLVEQASAKMVEMGLIEKVTGILTPDIMEILTLSVEQAFPGLLNLQDPGDLEEALQGVINGTIPLQPRGKLADAARGAAAAAAAGPAPGAGGLAPGAPELGGGGIPGAGAPGLV
jgi:hypothetical protein